MVEIYCKLIINKRRTFDRVPDIFKNEVESKLNELGYDTNGDLIITEEQPCFIEGNNMIALYVALIISSRRTFEQVPTKFKEAVKADLETIGLDENGNPV